MTDLFSVVRQYTLYIGYFLLIIGIIGNFLNIVLLSSVRSYRCQPSTFYFLIASIFNLIVIVVGLFSRLLEFGHGFDWSNSSLFWCKFRSYFITSVPLIPVYCQCFATLDQYFVTSKNVQLRQLSQITRAYWTSFILILISLLHGIPFYLNYQISIETKKCLCTNLSLLIYLAVFVLGIHLVLPTIFILVFGYLTYRNINRSIALTNQQADRQLTMMVFMQILLIISTAIPYATYQIYSFITIAKIKDSNRILIELFVMTIVSLNTYVYSGVRN